MHDTPFDIAIIICRPIFRLLHFWGTSGPILEKRFLFCISTIAWKWDTAKRDRASFTPRSMMFFMRLETYA